MRIAIDEALAGLRLDALLARAGGLPSVNAARRAIAEGRVRLDGRPARKGERARVGQVIDLDVAPAPGVTPSPELTLEVLHEDADLVAVNKPAGVPSHPLRPGEAPTAAGALAARYPECAAASPDPREAGLGHRLDRGTSGVLVAARGRAAWTALRGALAGGECEKVYRAEVVGQPRPPAPGDPWAAVEGDAVVVSAPIGRSGRRGARVRLGAGRQPLPARTEVRVLERRAATTLVEARLVRGRAHQVRAHLAHLGAPVVGDALYGNAPPDAPPDALRLHAAAIRFRHPITGRPLRIEAPLPAWAKVGR